MSKHGDVRGKGYEEPAVENPPHEKKDNFSVPEKDPGRTLSGKRLSGQTAGIGTKVRKFPSQK